METKKVSGDIASAYGKTLSPAIKFEGSYEAFQTYEELVAANAIPSNEDVLKFVNDRRKASAVQSARQEALDKAGVQAPTNADPQFAYKNMVLILVAQGKSQDEAEQLAKTILGVQ